MRKRLKNINLGNIERKRDKEGKLICLNCNRHLPKRRQKYCSDDCSFEWATKHSHQLLRDKLIKKYNGKCAICNKIPTKREERYSQLTDEEWIEIKHYSMVTELHNNYVLLVDSTQLILDHKIPIALGGAEFDESNLQILCLKCNKVKTRKDYTKIARARKLEKIIVNGQLILTKNKEENGSPPTFENVGIRA